MKAALKTFAIAASLALTSLIGSSAQAGLIATATPVASSIKLGQAPTFNYNISWTDEIRLVLFQKYEDVYRFELEEVFRSKLTSEYWGQDGLRFSYEDRVERHLTGINSVVSIEVLYSSAQQFDKAIYNNAESGTISGTPRGIGLHEYRIQAIAVANGTLYETMDNVHAYNYVTGTYDYLGSWTRTFGDNEWVGGISAPMLIEVVAHVPEPATLALLGAGLLGFAGMRRRKAQQLGF